MSDQEPHSVIERSADGIRFEHTINRHVANIIHLFLSVLAVLVLGIAVIATYDTLVRDVPALFRPTDEYPVLYRLIENILLIAIAAELGLLLLFHRTSAAIEVIVFVIARKILSPDLKATELLFGVAALSLLVMIRYYFLPGRPK
ncbi:MAG TPA: hypothetical protein VH877_28110 [Polyangia bacterium]|jgi:hypothetical protein|nr:hypothetical protein [Polyangia bacterium]